MFSGRRNARFSEQRWHNFARLIRFAALVVALSALISCGTAHHFLPPQPLESGQWQIAVSWHYNFKTIASPASAIVPDIYGYVGLSDDIVLGTGCTYILPTYLSAAHYYESSPNKYWITWGHGKLVVPYNNPFIEAGLGYSIRDGGTSSMVLVGVGLGLLPPWIKIDDRPPILGSPRWSLKCGLMGRDVGFNFSHYHGSTMVEMKARFPSWPPSADTILAFPAGEVVDIATLEEGFRNRWGLLLRTGDIFIMSSPTPYPDAFFDPRIALDNWAGDSLHFVYVEDSDDWAIVDLERIRESVRSGTPVIVCRAPQSLVDRIENTGWIEDTSLGWAVFAWPR